MGGHLSQPGILYLVATPIGNLEDMTMRAINVLTQVDHILAEDTRHSAKLLLHYNIKTAVSSLHEHNETKRAASIVLQLQQGRTFALISDAGTPLMSDPGYVLVRACIEHKIQVCSIPGPCALISALAASGVPTDEFHFCGFLPAKGQARVRKLAKALSSNGSLIFYEAGRRLPSFLQAMIELKADDREVVLAHELTKTFESYHRGISSELLLELENNAISPKGEWVICVAPASKDAVAAQQLEQADAMLSRLLPHCSTSTAVALVVELTGASKKHVYDLALAKK